MDDDVPGSTQPVDRDQRPTSSERGGRATIDPSPLPDRFRVEDELGRGGMGRVVRAHDRTLGRDVAIKEATDPALLARFEREIRITARLQHPSIVPLYDAGHRADGVPYYVMRRLVGQSLHDKIRASRDLHERLGLLPAFLAAADALAYAHEQRTIHRDLKPGNIMLGDHGETVVIDWGLAKLVDDLDSEPASASPARPGLTSHGAVLGTPGYMAPEQARGEPADERSDVYALGATLAHILRGSPPDDAPPSLPDVPRELATIVETAMAREPADRYANASGLAGDVRRFLTGQLVAAHRYSLRERIVRFARRHVAAIVVATAATIVIVVTVAIAVSNIVSSRDRATAGWGQATERGEDLLLSRAEALVDADPTRAALLATTLPLTSTRWARARAIVAAARGQGIARVLAGHGDPVIAIRIDPNERRLVTADDSRVVLHDLGTWTSRPLVDQPGVLDLAWIGDHELAVASRDRIRRIDVDGRTPERTLPAREARFASPGDAGYLAWRDRDGVYVWSSGEPTRLATTSEPGSIEVSRDGAWIATWSFHAPLEIYGRDGTRASLPRPFATVESVTIAADSRHVAVLFWDGATRRVVELELGATAIAESSRWDANPIGRVQYAGAQLFAITGDSQVLALRRGGATNVVALTRGAALSSAASAGELVVATGDNAVTLFDRSGSARALRSPIGMARYVVASPSGDAVFATGLDGSIVAWDLRAIRPRHTLADPECSYAGLLARNALAVCRDDDCRRIDLGDDSSVAMPSFHLPVQWSLSGPDAAFGLLGEVDGSVSAVRVRDSAVEHVSRARGWFAFAGPDAIAFTLGTTVAIARPFSATPISELASFPTEPRGLAASADVVAVALADRTLWQRDQRTGAARSLISTWGALTGALAVGNATVFAAAGNDLVAWTSDGARVVASLPAPIASMAFDRDLGITVVTGDGKLSAVHVVSAAGDVRSVAVPAGSTPPVLASPGTAIALSADRRVIVIDATAGTIWPIGSANATMFTVDREGGIVVRVHDRIELERDDLPRGPAELARWVAQATNVTLAPDLTALRWE